MADWLVDGMNVVGSRPDGWWRDRPRAMRALVRDLAALSRRTGAGVTVVFDGRPADVGDSGPVEVVWAPGPGPNAADRAISARLATGPHGPRVVTSDAALAADARAAGAEVVPAGRFRRLLEGEAGAGT